MRSMDWSRLSLKFLTSCVDVPRCRGRAHFYKHDLTRELLLIGFNFDRAAVQRGVSPSSAGHCLRDLLSLYRPKTGFPVF
jgi:hypothetical protein